MSYLQAKKDCHNELFRNLEIELEDTNINNNNGIINERNRRENSLYIECYKNIIKYIFGSIALYLIARSKYFFFPLAFISYFIQN